jgi:hypothetical protein
VRPGAHGAKQPRGLGALAKSLSMDMRSNERGWLTTKLESLMRAAGDDAFDLPMPPAGEPERVPSLVAGFARLVFHRCRELGAFEDLGPTLVLDALSRRSRRPARKTSRSASRPSRRLSSPWRLSGPDRLAPAVGDIFERSSGTRGRNTLRGLQ